MYKTTIYCPDKLLVTNNECIVLTSPAEAILNVREIRLANLYVIPTRVVKEYAPPVQGKEVGAAGYYAETKRHKGEYSPCLLSNKGLPLDCWVTLIGNATTPYLYYSTEWMDGKLEKQSLITPNSQVFIDAKGQSEVRDEENIGLKLIAAVVRDIKELGLVSADLITYLK